MAAGLRIVLANDRSVLFEFEQILFAIDFSDRRLLLDFVDIDFVDI
eukprot:gene13312-9539_t